FRKFGTKQQRCFGIFPQNGEITPASTASWQIYKRNRFKAGVAAGRAAKQASHTNTSFSCLTHTIYPYSLASFRKLNMPAQLEIR
ncbi:hypothetical protein JWJ90_22205, partial [Desulfobulbus rhabdoformis]|uniref:hypothetical protein n=1 Tax=Desulfobulbus rhabdoformis TaxID=34032 RepID=UPI001965F4E2